MSNLDGWFKATEQLPTHLQDCVVIRLVDGLCRLYQSQYYAGQIMQGFGDLEDGESFYDDVLYWMPVELQSVCEAIMMQLQISEATNES